MIADDDAKVRENGAAARWVSSAEARDVNLEVCMVGKSRVEMILGFDGGDRKTKVEMKRYKYS
jgi:hypothetical protein